MTAVYKIALIRLVFFVAVCFWSKFGPLEAEGCFENERSALLEFRKGLQDPSGRLLSWVGSDCCNWTGVVCNNETGRVVRLDLSSALEDCGFSGVGNRCFGGRLSRSLRRLTFLSYLDLKNNNFGGLAIPQFVGSFARLRYLDLSNASFLGLIPSEIGALSNLRYLNLSQWSSKENLWVEDLNWLSGLSSLHFLDLSNANLSKASSDWLNVVNTLPSLQELRLSNCDIRELPLSLSFVNITSLVVLDLSHNEVNSSIPKWLHNITSLEHLRLEKCGLEGQVSEIPAKETCNLRILELAFNKLGGGIDTLVENLSYCGNNSLEWLDLNSNRITGTLPESLMSFKNLRYISLSNNLMSGPIPASMGNLSRLSVLSLHSNSFEGIISEVHFQKLTNLRLLSLSSENGSLAFNVNLHWKPPFSGLVTVRITDVALGPSFPVWFSTQKMLLDLTLIRTGIADTVPDFIWNLAPFLRLLDLSGNQLSGTLPDSLNFHPDAEVYLGDNHLEGVLPNWNNISMFSLRNNRFLGTIPSSFHLGLSELIFLDLSGNSLTGEIPRSLQTLKKLKYLDLSNNQFSGSMYRNWEGLDKLYVMDLSRNNLSGRLPETLCSQIPSLRWFRLSRNSLYGDLSWLKNCTKLTTLDLKENEFSGSIPEQIAEELPDLMELTLRGNMISGKIPEAMCRLSYLHILDLAVNNLSGPIPSCIGDLVALKVLSFYFPMNAVDKPLGAKISDWIVEGKQMELIVKGRQTEFRDIIQIVNTIDLSVNHLTGLIPEDITKLRTLGFLNLSWNQLTGPLPENMGNLRQLETLDVTHNRLSGVIPPSMTSMTLLNHLNLSHNNFSGVIPRSNQFSTFNYPSAYEGNPGLCGPPLPVSCSAARGVEEQDNNGKVQEVDKGDDEMVWFYVGMAVGAAVGFLAFCGTLMVKKSWRQRYFSYIDRFLRKLHRTTASTSGTDIQRGLTTGTPRRRTG